MSIIGVFGIITLITSVFGFTWMVWASFDPENLGLKRVPETKSK
jgi:hypothetical protein